MVNVNRDEPVTVRVERVGAATTFPLRQRVLRPHQKVDELASPDDDARDAGHFAAFDLDGTVVGTASVGPAAPPWAGGPDPGPAPDQPGWRLRGMAITENLRGRGVGSLVLAATIDHVRGHGGGILWCNARLPAVPFYLRAGLRTRGEAWEDPLIGPHIVMWRLVGA
jgi:GNAT superfamily N-acetyltransferase